MSYDRKKNRAIVMDIVQNCPAGEPVKDCIVHPLREVHFIDAHVLVRKLSDTDLAHIINHHKTCLTKRPRTSCR